MKCSGKPTVVEHGRDEPQHLVLRQRKDARVGALSTGGHNFPAPGRHPGRQQLIWSFMSKTPLAPVPS